MAKCAENPAHGATVRDTRLCEGCYRAALDRARRELSPRRERSRSRVGGTTATVTPDEGAREERVVSILHTHGRGMARLDLAQALRVSDRTITRILREAKAAGRVHLAADGWRAGSSSDVAGEDAVTVAAHVRERGTSTRQEIDKATGLGHTRMVAGVKRARAEGWLAVENGRGFVPGPVEPPATA